MAEAPDVTEKGLEELEDEISCPVCQEHFRDPKVLPCCHYYCAECIRLLVDQKNPFPCPECRRDTVLPQNDPNQLPPAFFVNRMMEVYAKMEKVQGKVEAMCEMCSGAKATAFCRQCTDFICDDCVRSHRKLRVFAGHEVATLQELKEGGAKRIALKEAPPIMCKEHDEPVKIFCFDCNGLICRDCIVIDHAGHKYEFVKKAAPQCKEKLNKSVAPLRKIREDIASATQEVQRAEAEIRTQGTQVTDSINQAFLQLMENLKQRQQELLQKTSTSVQLKLDKLSVQEKNFQLTTTMVQSLIEFVERNLENATDEELMSVHKQILTRVEEERQKHGDLDLEVTEKADIGPTLKPFIDSIVECCHKTMDAQCTDPTADDPGLKRPEINKLSVPSDDASRTGTQPQHTDRNLKVVWVDANIANSENSGYIQELKKNKKISLFATSSTDEAFRALKKKKKGTEYRVITSGQLGQTFVPKLREELGIHCRVLVFCMSVTYHNTWACKYENVTVTRSPLVMMRFASWN